MAYVGHQNVSGIGGLITSATFTDKFNTKIHKGLPNFTKIAGSTKLASVELSGIVTNQTSISASHSTYTTTSFAGAGGGVNGILTSLSLSGKLGGEVTFTAVVEGVKSGGASSTADPGDIQTMYDASISIGESSAKVLSFSLSASWDIEWVYDKSGGNWPYPEISSCILKSFDGKLSVQLNQTASLGSTASEVSFSISVGGLSISGKGYETENKAEDSPDGIFGTTRTFIISELSIA